MLLAVRAVADPTVVHQFSYDSPNVVELATTADEQKFDFKLLRSVLNGLLLSQHIRLY